MIILFLFVCFDFLNADEIEYNLKRFDINFYNKSYSGTIKYKTETRNKFEKITK